MKVRFLCVVVIISSVLLQGCGETVRGVGRDFSRVGRGIKTIFSSDM